MSSLITTAAFLGHVQQQQRRDQTNLAAAQPSATEKANQAGLKISIIYESRIKTEGGDLSAVQSYSSGPAWYPQGRRGIVHPHTSSLLSGLTRA